MTSSSQRFLLDVNLLVALVDPLHVGHESAHKWLQEQMAKNGRLSWASCVLTMLGFLRVLSNPAYPGGPTPLGNAAESLQEFRVNHSDHEYWDCAQDLVAMQGYELERIQGHKQLTDAYLVILCLERKAVLATLDAKISASPWARDHRQHIETLPFSK